MREQIPLPRRGQAITADYMGRIVRSVNLFNTFSVSGSAKYDSGTASLHVGGSGSGAAIVVKTPVGGIPARSGDVLGTAACVRCQLGSDGEDVVVQEIEDSEVTVLNLASGIVGEAGGVLVIAVKVDGHWLAVWEDCA